MKPWRKAIVFTAFFLLASAAVDLLGVDLWSPLLCDESSSENGSRPSSNDDCFCCCTHIVLTRPIVLEPAQICAVAESLPSMFMTNAEPTGIYHPPRS